MSSLDRLQTFQAVHLKGRVPPNKRFELTVASVPLAIPSSLRSSAAAQTWR